MISFYSVQGDDNNNNGFTDVDARNMRQSPTRLQASTLQRESTFVHMFSILCTFWLMTTTSGPQ